jgi:membrane protein
MARINDVPKVLHSMGFMGFAKKVWAEIGSDEVFTWGSALAYAWIFAIFPFMIFLLTLAPYLPGTTKQKAMDQIAHVTSSGIGGDAGGTVAKSLNDVMSHQKGGLLSIGLILALWGASGGMSMTMSALDKAYYVHCTRSYIKQRAIAIGLTVATVAIILLVIFLLPIGTGIIAYLAKHGHIALLGKILINVVRYVIALGLLFGVVSMIYYFGPCIKQKYHAITPGAIFTVVVWIVLGFAFAFYVTHFGNFNATYGALGGAIILLLFFYINAVVLVIGAEVNSVIDFEVLSIKPGVTDISAAAAKDQYAQSTGGAKKGGPGGAKAGGKKETEHQPVHLPIVPPEPATHRTRNLVLFASSLLATRYAWKKIWTTRAKNLAKERAKARHWWWPRATT